MKKIFKLLFLSLFIITVSSCDNEDMELLTISAKGSGEITAPETGFSQILNPEEEQTNTALTLTWNPADYGIPTGITYNIEFAKEGTDFADAYVAGSTSNAAYSWNISELNGAAVNTGLAPFVEGGIDIRIIATVGSLGSTPQTTGMITVYITPFTTDLPTISVPGNHQGWDPATAPLLAASAFGQTDYIGYVWLTTKGDEGFKFLAPDQTGGFFWGNIDWGDDGSYEATSDGKGIGTLIENDEVNCKIDADGYYLVKVNPSDTGIDGFLQKKPMAYSTELTNWGLIGSATPDGWDSDQDMTYDVDTQTLKITLELSADHIKFRANDDWSLNYGDTGADGSLEEGGDDIKVPSAGNYTVTLDLSNPRDYTYSLVKN